MEPGSSWPSHGAVGTDPTGVLWEGPKSHLSAGLTATDGFQTQSGPGGQSGSTKSRPHILNPVKKKNPHLKSP